MYNCGVKSIYEPQIFARCEKSLLYYENRLPPRLIFGGLYGALKTNAASKSLMNFLIEEFKKLKRGKIVFSKRKIVEQPKENEKDEDEGEIKEKEEEEEVENQQKDTSHLDEKPNRKPRFCKFNNNLFSFH